MKSLNKVQLLGRTGGDPEIRYTQSNQAVANVSIATSYSVKQPNGEYEERVDWHRVTIFGKSAENVQKYVKKGDMIFIEGRLKPGEYTDKDGKKVYKIDIIADDVLFLGQKRQGETAQSEPAQAPAQRQNASTNEFDNFIGGDDLPF